MRIWGLGIAAAVLAGLSTESGATQFVDVTASAGLDRTYLGSDVHMGAGAAWLDYDKDGDYDVYLTDWGGGGALLRNELVETGMAIFTDVTLDTGAWDGRDGQGVSAVDYDNDGDEDLYLVNFDRDTLLQNQLAETGTAEFLDVTVAVGLDLASGWGQTGSWGDLDGDGRLDLYVGGFYVFENYICGGGGSGPACAPDMLFHAQPDGTFVDIAEELGVATEECHFVTVWSDYDQDGDLDLWSGYDRAQITQLWRNDGPDAVAPWKLTLQDPVATGTFWPISDMGIAVGDVNRDGWLDYYHTNGSLGNKLCMNDGDGTFTEAATSLGVRAGFDDAGNVLISWGDVIADLDNDGWRDIYAVTGYIDSCQPIPGSIPNQINLYYHNEAGAGFVEQAATAGLALDLDARGLAAADYDGDGDVDLLLGHPREGYRLLRNDLAPGPNRRWLKVLPVGVLGNRSAVGAWVELETPEALWVDEVRAGSSLGSMNSRELEFGLGATTELDRVRVRFPGGREIELRDQRANQTLVVFEPTLTLELEPSVEAGRPGETVDFRVRATDVSNQPQQIVTTLTLRDAEGRVVPLLRRGPGTLPAGATATQLWSVPIGNAPPGPALFRLTVSDALTGRLLQNAYAEFTVEPE